MEKKSASHVGERLRAPHEIDGRVDADLNGEIRQRPRVERRYVLLPERA
jgi:hypothetical protein